MSDNYEFMKTSEVQDVTDYSQYVDKQYNNYINDINNMVDTYDYDTISKYIEEIDHIKIIIGNFDFNIFNQQILTLK